MNARDYLNILHVAEKLKDTPRHCATTQGRTESVAEHSWRVSLMPLLLKREFPDVNIDRVFVGSMGFFITGRSVSGTKESLCGDGSAGN